VTHCIKENSDNLVSRVTSDLWPIRKLSFPHEFSTLIFLFEELTLVDQIKISASKMQHNAENVSKNSQPSVLFLIFHFDIFKYVTSLYQATDYWIILLKKWWIKSVLRTFPDLWKWNKIHLRSIRKCSAWNKTMGL